MPIFAFFIGEGCLYTRNARKYISRIFLLGVLCQLFYVGEYLFTKSSNPFYLNILMTFSASAVLCTAFRSCFNENEEYKKGKETCIFALLFSLFALLCILNEKGIIPFQFDYGFGGIVLPLFAATTKERKKKLLLFSAGLLLCVISFDYSDLMWSVCAMLSLIPLSFYNGKPGTAKLNLAFYLFYPLHLGVLYLISILL